MKFMITVKFTDNTTATVETEARHAYDAQYRAAVKAEKQYEKTVERVIRTLKA